MKKHLLVFILFLTLASNIKANHVMGGDMAYKKVGQDSFLITVNSYKDCKGVNLSTPTIGIRGIGFVYSASFTPLQISCKDVTPVCRTQCSKCDPSNCNSYGYPNGSNPNCTFPMGIEKLTYQQLIILPNNLNSNNCQFKFFFSDCCRNGITSTCCNGESYYNEMILDRCSGSNSSPTFNVDYSYILPIGAFHKINFSATDSLDNDSLSYQLDYPKTASGTPCTYTAPYTYKRPFQFVGFPNTTPNPYKNGSGFLVDSSTGFIYTTPTTQQIANITMKVKEWRKDTTGVMQNIGFVIKDIPIYLVDNYKNIAPTTTIKKDYYICKFDTFALSFISSDSTKTDSISVKVLNPFNGMSVNTSYANNKRIAYTDIIWPPNYIPFKDTVYKLIILVNDNHCPIPFNHYEIINIHIVDTQQSNGLNIRKYSCDYITIKPNNPNLKNSKWLITDSNGDTTAYSYSKTISFVEKRPGKYYILLTSGAGSCLQTTKDSMVILPKTMSINLGRDTTICAYNGMYINFDIIPKISGVASKNYTLVWTDLYSSANFSNANQININQTVNNKNYEYLIECSIIDSLGCRVSDTIHIVVSNVRQTPSSTFQKFFGCENDTVSISAPSWYATTKFKWNTGDTLQTIAVTDSGFYYATLTDKGCSYTDSVQVIKLPYPIYTPLTDTSICPNSSVILKPNAVNYDSIKWNAKTVSDSIIISAASNPFYTIYKSYIITNNNKLVCKISDTLQVTILAIQGLELGNNQNACAGDSLRLMPNHIYNTYLWNTNETSADIYVKNTGMYTLWVKDMNGCDEKDSIYTNFYIKPDGSYSYQISQGFNVAFMPVYNSYAQYQWQFGDGVNSMLVSPSHIYASSGNYRSSLVVSDSNNCIDSSAQYIFFSGINSLSVAANKLLAFPNPFSNQITISGNIPNGLVLVEWFDSWGRKIYQTYKTASLGNLNIYAPEQLNSGVSFIKISTESWQGSVLVLKE
jgi:hypothetical protein